MAYVQDYLRMRRCILSARLRASVYSFAVSCSNPEIFESTRRDSMESIERVGSIRYFFQTDVELNELYVHS